MPDKPQRPLRPDEEEELARFHNGDTLDNIPVVRLPAQHASPVQPTPRSAWRWMALVVCVGVLGGLAGAGVALFTKDGERHEAAPNASAAPSVSAHLAASPSPSSPASPPSTPEPSVETADEAGLEQVRIIQTPATGGDISTTYCLVYTGSESDGVKEAVLLSNAPAYQCADLLSYDPAIGSLYESVPVCEPPARMAMLVFDPASAWGDALYFSCLTEHTGA